MARIIRGPGGGAPIVGHYKVPQGGSFQPFQEGKLVYLDSSGLLLPTTGNPPTILGVALKSVPKETTEYIPVAIVTPETLLYLDGQRGGGDYGPELYAIDASDQIDTNPAAPNKCVRVLRAFGNGGICIPSWNSGVWQFG